MIHVTQGKDGAVFTAKVVPRASHNEIAGVREGVVRIRLTAPPAGGAASRALVWVLPLALLTALSMLAAACAPAPTETTSPLSIPTASPSTEEATGVPDESEEGTASTGEAADLPPEVAALVEKARMDLSQRLNVSPEDISLLSVEAMQWRDSSLGCPRPGMNYLMVITPGYLIILSAQGREFEYHTDSARVVFCEQ